MSTNEKKQERIQRKFVALCQNHFFTYDHVTYEDFLKFLKLHTHCTAEDFIVMDYILFPFIPV